MYLTTTVQIHSYLNNNQHLITKYVPNLYVYDVLT